MLVSNRFKRALFKLFFLKSKFANVAWPVENSDNDLQNFFDQMKSVRLIASGSAGLGDQALLVNIIRMLRGPLAFNGFIEVATLPRLNEHEMSTQEKILALSKNELGLYDSLTTFKNSKNSLKVDIAFFINSIAGCGLDLPTCSNARMAAVITSLTSIPCAGYGVQMSGRAIHFSWTSMNLPLTVKPVSKKHFRHHLQQNNQLFLYPSSFYQGKNAKELIVKIRKAMACVDASTTLRVVLSSSTDLDGLLPSRVVDHTCENGTSIRINFDNRHLLSISGPVKQTKFYDMILESKCIVAEGEQTAAFATAYNRSILPLPRRIDGYPSNLARMDDWMPTWTHTTDNMQKAIDECFHAQGFRLHNMKTGPTRFEASVRAIKFMQKQDDCRINDLIKMYVLIMVARGLLGAMGHFFSVQKNTFRLKVYFFMLPIVMACLNLNLQSILFAGLASFYSIIAVVGCSKKEPGPAAGALIYIGHMTEFISCDFKKVAAEILIILLCTASNQLSSTPHCRTLSRNMFGLYKKSLGQCNKGHCLKKDNQYRR